MSLRQYLILMSIATMMCWVAWFFVLNYTTPSGGGLLALFFFYCSLFLAIVGTFSVIGFLIRRFLVKDDEIVFRHVRRTFRQSLLLSTLVIFALMLLAARLLTWWNSIVLIIFFLFLEAVIFTNRKFHNENQYGL
ncbi:MAG: hypothetical protein HY983_00080 [Candidatus Magasanikbacteria bacterium]|nr:hypothetical protein [Candidatus Magasanikbacteria bacterium]